MLCDHVFALKKHNLFSPWDILDNNKQKEITINHVLNEEYFLFLLYLID